jgi:hypothetical protein
MECTPQTKQAPFLNTTDICTDLTFKGYTFPCHVADSSASWQLQLLSTQNKSYKNKIATGIKLE